MGLLSLSHLVKGLSFIILSNISSILAFCSRVIISISIENRLGFGIVSNKLVLNIKPNSFCCAAKSCLSTRQSTNYFSKEGTQILPIFTIGDSVTSFLQ